MNEVILEVLGYLGTLLLQTLGMITVCGLAVNACSNAFARLLGLGSGVFFDATAVLGTPVHELGHAMMCPLFGHRIRSMRLWNPGKKGGVYGYVEHTYNPKNLWARLGNLFIGVGPVFSGMGVVVLTLWLCFPTLWSEYLHASLLLAEQGELSVMLPQLGQNIWELFLGIFRAFSENVLRSCLGLLLLLSVSLHISLSWQDIKSGLSAFPLYLALLTLFGLLTYGGGLNEAVCNWLMLWNLRALTLFCVVIAFSVLWVALALLFRAGKKFVSWF